MSKPEHIARPFRAVASRFGEGSRQAVDSRDVTREEKIKFLNVCYSICPCFKVSEGMKPVLNDILRWCLMLEGKHDPEKGLWLWGEIGTGKSTMLEIIRQYCRTVRPPGIYRERNSARQMRSERLAYGFRITNASVVAGEFARSSYPGIEEYITNCRQAFDELGRECIPTGFFGNLENVFQYIIQRRYDLRHGDFTHVTTNLKPEEISSVYGDHIYDRCIEMFNFVEMSGESCR